MGAKVQIEKYMPGHCSMRDLSRESNGSSWPSCYSENNLPNGQFYYGFLLRSAPDVHPGYDKDVVKQTMLEHEAIFKNQVYELHRLYRVQRDLMDEVRRKEPFIRQTTYEASSSSSPVPPQMQFEDVQKWTGSNLPLANSISGRPPTLGPDAAILSSPLSIKGKNIQTGPSSIQNSYSPRNSELSESRPTKLRRKMLDLQLPADEYIDTDEVEQLGDAKLSDTRVPSPDKNGMLGLTSGKSKVLADLNEPLSVEETTAISSVDFLGRPSCQRDVQLRGVCNNILRSSKDIPLNSHHGSSNATLSKLPFENRSKGTDWLCYASEPEQHKTRLGSIHQGTNERKPSIPQLVQVPYDQACQPPAFLAGDHDRGDPWKMESVGAVEKSERSYSMSSYDISDQIRPSYLPNQPNFNHHSDLRKSWDPCASPWDKQSSCLNQKSVQGQTSPLLTSSTLNKNPLSSGRSNNLLGNKWNLNNIPGANASFGAEPSLRNGFYQGSSAPFREAPIHFPASGVGYTNGNYSDKKLPVKDVNLNVPLPNGISNGHTDRKSNDPVAVLPWLRGKGMCKNETENSRKVSNPLDSAQVLGLAVNSSHREVKAELIEDNSCQSSRKILGIPIFESPTRLNKQNSLIISSSGIDHRSRKEEVESSRRRVVFDMNLPCDPEPTDSEPAVEEVIIVERKMRTETATLRNHFDLNSCITEEEILCGNSLLDNSASIRGGTGIDLEAPVIIESDDEPLAKEPEMRAERKDDSEPELAKAAAEAIVIISAFVERNHAEGEAMCLTLDTDLEDALHWFVDIACSSSNDLEIQQAPNDGYGNHGNGDCSQQMLDDFESLTLSLKECSPDEYFPKPSFPEVPNTEETGKCLLTTRTRKGHARRGRQRRDFQRDILPGLISLSRHEVTEDLQTFGGLMRATGHAWHSGLNRRNATRNGCGRGRRRAVIAAPPPPPSTIPPPSKQESNSTEVCLEDRSLTGWGKTTRRPRRQRCPAGNPPLPVQLS